MPLDLRLRFLLVCLLLRAAEAWAARHRSSHRGRGLVGPYRLAPASETYGFDGPFDYVTAAGLPPEERYRGPIRAAKALVVAALRIPLRSDARWRDVGELDGLYRLLGEPAIRGLAPDGDLDDATFLRLRRDGPHAHWVRRDGDGWIVDYRALLEGLPVVPGRRLEPCALAWDDGGPRLWVGGRWWRPDEPGWADRRRLFHLAELHVHEVVSHLLWTHLHAEAIAILTVEHLSPSHPIRRLLAPHFAFTLQANHNSGRVLLGRRGFFERVLSCGWDGAAELLRRGDAAWRHARTVPRLDLDERGAHDLPDYPWREDAVALWDVVEAHVRRRLGADPLDVEARAWARALHARWGDRGLPACTGPDVLVELVTAALFLTVRHTLVNAEQYAMFGYPPLWPAALHAGATLAEQLPTVGQTLDTLRATYAFSIQYGTLGGASEDSAFEQDLAALGDLVSARDRTRPRPFRVGHPRRVSGSIDA